MNALVIVLSVLFIVLSVLVIVVSALYLTALKKIKSFEAKRDVNPEVGVLNSKVKKESDILNLLSGSEKLLLARLDGRRIISEAHDIFRFWIDSDFENLGLNKKSKATTETEIQIYEMAKNATFKDMFTSLSNDLDSLCLTQSQIIDFCINHSEHLIAIGSSTFFLTKKDFEKSATSDNLFVVAVLVASDGLPVRVDRFGDASVWRADDHRRLVVPKLS